MVTKIVGDMIATDTVVAGNIAAGSVGASEIATGAVGSDEIAADAVGSSEIAVGAVGADELAATLDLSGKTLTLPAANTPAFTKSYTSAAQTITAAGALTLAHSLGGMPALVQVRLKCTSGEHGYSINDEVIFNSGDQNAGRGCSIVPDATNLNIRYGSAAQTFNVNHKTTGASSAITNASWQAIFKAWA